jgi:hypothetical protein
MVDHAPRNGVRTFVAATSGDGLGMDPAHQEVDRRSRGLPRRTEPRIAVEADDLERDLASSAWISSARARSWSNGRPTSLNPTQRSPDPRTSAYLASARSP